MKHGRAVGTYSEKSAYHFSHLCDQFASGPAQDDGTRIIQFFARAPEEIGFSAAIDADASLGFSCMA